MILPFPNHTQRLTTGMSLWVALLLTVAVMLSGCESLQTSASKHITATAMAEKTAFSTPEKESVFSWYDTAIYDSESQRPISLVQAAQTLLNADVVFVGEFHGHPASHLLEASLQAELYRLRPHQVLSMEQFERDRQSVVNQYLDDEIGEKTLQTEARAWPNYEGSYRPLIEFAKTHWIPVIAANAPQDIVRCVGRYGADYLTRLPDAQREWVANQPQMTQVEYETKFSELMGAGRHNADKNFSYQAQLLRDNTMAESILEAHKRHPDALIFHTNGTFHSESFLGTVGLLKARAPQLNIAVITPVMQTNPFATPSADAFKKGTLIYTVAPLPEPYRSAQKRHAAMAQMFERASSAKCIGE